MLPRNTLGAVVITACLMSPAAAAEPSDDGSTGNLINSGTDAAHGSVEGVGRYTNKTKFRASGQSRAFNNKVRKGWASKGNLARKTIGKVLDTNAAKAVPYATLLTDMSTGLGHVSAGNYAEGSASMINEGAKGVVSSAGGTVGAAAGTAAGVWLATKTFGVAGFTVGGPVGGIIGGAVGGFVGAVGTGMVYDAYAGETVTGALQHALTSKEPTPFERSVAERHDYRRKKGLYDDIAKSIAERERLLMKRYGYDNRATDAPTDASIPVIPVDCTISMVSWNPKYPKYKIAGTYRVRGGTVSGTAKLTNWPPADAKLLNYKERMWFEGTIEDNRISGIWHDRTSYESVSDTCTTISSSKGKAVIQCELRLGGTLKEMVVSTAVVNHTFKNVAEGVVLTPKTHTSGPSTVQMEGTWSFAPDK